MTLKLIAAGLLTITLTACVTVTDSRLTRKASPEKAVENYTQLGLGYLQKSRNDMARARLRKALEIDEDYAPANDAMGLLWQAEGEMDLAEEAFHKAISHDSSFTLAKHHLGRLYMRLKRFGEAESWLQTAAEDRYYESRTAAYNDLALNYYRMKMPQEAIKAYRETLRIAPYNVDALVNVSTLLFEAQQYDASLKHFDRLHRLVERDKTRHTSHSLWLGIKLATIHRDVKRGVDLASRLKQDFPQSNEYRLYQESLAGVKN
ncbi:MAG: hypothetical protein CMI09_05210 [Oceanospirillaceae bacterium]|nr:hypothetical protein [Oceanospirillaceae bacterium]